MSWQPTGWVPGRTLNAIPTPSDPNSFSVPGGEPTPPQYLLDAMGGSYDTSKWSWNPESMSLVDRYTGATLGYGHIPDPSLGTDVVLSPWQVQQNPEIVGGSALQPYPFAGAGGVTHFEGDAPFIGSPDGGRMFISNDPAAISEYNHDARTRNWQGIGKVGALVGGAAALGGALGPAGGTGTATVTGANTAAGYALPTAGGAVAPAATAAGAGTAAGTTAATGAGAAAAGGIGGAIMSNLPTIISGAASLLGGKLASDAAGDAVDAQVAAGDRALDYQRESRDIALGIVRPQLQASNVALAQMLQMTGQPIPASLQEALTEAGITDIGEFDITKDPSYQFRLDESMKALENSAFARGGGMSGGFANQALRYAQNFASTEYSNIYGRLATIGGYGPVAANSSSNAALSYGANASNIATNTGDARASGYVAQSNAWQNALDQIAKLPWDQWFPGRQPATAGP